MADSSIILSKETSDYPYIRTVDTGTTRDSKQVHCLSTSNYDGTLERAIRRIESQFGDTVLLKDKGLLKFGRNGSVGTSTETVMGLQGSEVHETYATTNAIDSISSSDNGDTQSVTIEGHYFDGSNNLVFTSQDVTLQGNTKVPLTTDLCRATRLANNGSDFAGTVYVYEDDTTTTPGIPDTDSKVHVVSEPGYNQSLKASTSISYQDYYIILALRGSTNRKSTSTFVDFELQTRQLSGTTGLAFRTQELWTVSNVSGSFQLDLPEPIIIPPNSDVRIVATSTASATAVTASMNGVLALIQS